jgi:hypothetical protein
MLARNCFLSHALMERGLLSRRHSGGSSLVGNYTFELKPVKLAYGSNIGKLADQEFNITGKRDVE